MTNNYRIYIEQQVPLLVEEQNQDKLIRKNGTLMRFKNQIHEKSMLNATEYGHHGDWC
jgi:hypothetical protein